MFVYVFHPYYSVILYRLLIKTNGGCVWELLFDVQSSVMILLYIIVKDYWQRDNLTSYQINKLMVRCDHCGPMSVKDYREQVVCYSFFV